MKFHLSKVGQVPSQGLFSSQPCWHYRSDRSRHTFQTVTDVQSGKPSQRPDTIQREYVVHDRVEGKLRHSGECRGHSLSLLPASFGKNPWTTGFALSHWPDCQFWRKYLYLVPNYESSGIFEFWRLRGRGQSRCCSRLTLGRPTATRHCEQAEAADLATISPSIRAFHRRCSSQPVSLSCRVPIISIPFHFAWTSISFTHFLPPKHYYR